jgi:sulfotransferase family protein
MPDFLCIGAQKAGTTWLYRNLRAHPRIWMPREKELHYFDEKLIGSQRLPDKLWGDRPEDLRWRRQVGRQLRSLRADHSFVDLRWSFRYFLSQPNDQWYLSLFAPGRGRITGEITPAYSMLDSTAVARVHRLLPDARIIFLLRNPVERAWSHALMEVVRRRGRIDERWSDLLRHFESEGSRLRTDYVRTLDSWSEQYPPEQVFLGFLEDVHFHPGRLLQSICLFLTLEEPASWPHLGQRVYSTSRATIPRELATRLAETHGELVQELDRRLGGYAAWWGYSTRRLAEGDGLEHEIGFPLYESSLWRDWAKDFPGRVDGGGTPAFQSGTLRAIMTRPGSS